MATLWVVREIDGIEGSSKEYSTIALSFEFIHNYAEDASTLSKDAIKNGLRKAKPDLTGSSIGHTAGQIYRFAHKMNEGEFVLTPIRETPKVLMGKITGPYVFDQNYAVGFCPRFPDGFRAHTRRVEWRKTVTRDSFPGLFQDMLRFSEQSVFQPRKCASQRLKEFIKVLQEESPCLPGDDGM